MVMCSQFRRSIAALALATSVGQAAPALACSPIPPEFAEILTDRWSQAMSKGDAAALIELYADDAVITSPAHDTALATTHEIKRHVTVMATTFRLAELPARTIRIGCNTILDFGHLNLETRKEGARQSFSLSYSRVYEKRGTGWLITLDHMSDLDRLRRPRRTAAKGHGASAKDQSFAGRMQARDDMNKLMRSISPEPVPRVAGMLIRPPELALSPLKREAEPIPVSTTKEPQAPVLPATAVKRQKPKKSSLDWARSIQGFGGMR